MNTQYKHLAYTPTVSYPELTPITERQLERIRQHRSQQRKHVSSFQLFSTGLIILAFAFGFFQALRAMVADAYTFSILFQNTPVIEQYYSQALSENQMLQEKIQIYSSPEGIEELARNSLNMVSDEEILVRLN